MTQPLNRQDHPPEAGPTFFVKRLKASEQATMTILSRSIWGTWVHWAGSHSEPCYSEKKQCPGCKRGLPKKWKGYLHAFEHEARRHIFFEITPYSANQILDQAGADNPLRGLRLVAVRGKGDKARVRCEVKAATQEPDALPAERDPLETLSKLWEMNGAKIPPARGLGDDTAGVLV